MNWQWLTWLWPHLSLIAALTYSAMALRARLRVNLGSLIPVMLTGGIALLAADALEYAGAEVVWKLWWDNLQYAVLALLAGGYFALTVRHNRQDRIRLAGVSLVSLTFAMAFVFDVRREIMTADTWLVASAGNLWLHRLGTTWFLLYFGWIVLVGVWSSLRLVLDIQRGPTGAPYQSINMIVVATLTLAAAAIDFSRESPWPYFQLTSLVYGALALSVSWNLARLRHRDEQIALRWNALEEMTDPYLVLGQQDRIVDANQATVSLSGASRQDLIGHPLKQTWPELQERITQAVDAQPGLAGRPSWEILISLQQSSLSRRYRVRRSVLQDSPGLPFRALLTLRAADNADDLQPQLNRIARELGSSHYVTESMLSLERLPVVMDRVALALVSNLDFDAVWVARIQDGGRKLSWLAFRSQFGERLAGDLLDLIGGDPGKNILPAGAVALPSQGSPVYQRLQRGERIIDQRPVEYFTPWRSASHCQKVLQRSGLSAACAVPAEAGGRVLGFILAATRTGVISPYQQEALRRTAAQAAVVIENRRLQELQEERAEEIERSRTLLAALGQVAALLPVSADPEEIMKAVGAGLRRLSITCYFADYSDDNSRLRIRYISTHPQTLAAAERLAGLSRITYRLPQNLGPLEPVLRRQRPVYLEDMTVFSSVFLPQLPPKLALLVYRAVGIPPGTPGAYLPLALETGKVGVFGVWGSNLRQEDLLALEIFSHQVSTALHSGRMLQQEQQRAQSASHTNALLTALSRVTAALPLTKTPLEVMSAVGSQLRLLGLTCYFGEPLPGGKLKISYINFESDFLRTIERLAKTTQSQYTLSSDLYPIRDVLQGSSIFVDDASALVSVFVPHLPAARAKRLWELFGLVPGVSAAYAPLNIDGEVAGLLGVWGANLLSDDLNTITIFAAQVSSALKFVRSYELEQQNTAALSRSNARIAVLGEIAAKLRSALQPDEVLKALGLELRSLNLNCYLAERHPDGKGMFVRYLSVEPSVQRLMERLAERSVSQVRLPDGQFPARQVLQGETVFIADLPEMLVAYMNFLPESISRQVIRLAGISEKSRAVWMPLRTPAGVLGILAIWGENLWEEDIPALSVFGNQVGVALEYSRLHTETTRQLRRQTLLRQASEAWHSSLKLESVLRQVAEQFCRALDVTSVTICNYDSTSGETRVLADFIAETASPAEKISDVGATYFFELQVELRLKQGVIQFDLSDGQLSEAERQHLDDHGCQSVVVVPLEGRGPTSFFAELWETRGARTFTPEELALCQELANTAAMVVENAHLYAELQQRLQERSAVMSAADAVLASQDLSEVTTRLAETLGKAIDATSAYFIFYNTEERSYAVIAEYIGPGASQQEHESDLGVPYYDDTSELMFMLLQGVPVVQHAGQWNLNPEYQQHLERYAVQSVMFLPLSQASTGLMGYIEVWETRARREFSQAELRLCQAIAQQASIAIEKSRLYVIAQREIGEREQAELRLRQSEQEYRSLFENAHDAILLFDLQNGKIQEVNPQACEMYGYTRAELLRSDLMALSLDPAAEQRQWESVLAESSRFHLRTLHRRKHGGEMHLEVTGAPVIYGGRQVMQCILRDVTERVQAEERLRFDAFHDGLTNLPNRALFLERLERAGARYQRDRRHAFAVLFLDLDQFKKVNDTRGHFLGDKLLVQAARRLEACVRAVDTVARLGGDEFVILMEDIREILDASALCERILSQFRQPFYMEDEPVYATVSIGVVMSDSAYATSEAYLRDADIAMYRAKAAGRNRYEVFDAEMREQVIKRLELENDLRQAVEMEHFQVYYMPIVELQTSQVVGFEALLRWNHPQRGLVPPIHFIPIAEETGLILPLGEWVLTKACQQMRAWQGRFPGAAHLAVNVNISGVQLAQSDLVGVVRAALQESGLSPRSLCLEVTESALIREVQRTLGIITELKDMGVSVQLDDFGTGYSALSYLRQFPIDAIKIDRSFMGGRDGSHRGSDLIRTMVLMGHELGIQVVAEGVETSEHLEYLRSVNCGFGQGFLFARPLQPRSAEAYLLENLPKK